MKVYVCCDIEGVAGLAAWDEARSQNACYEPMAREMSLEAAACARGAFAAGASRVVIEDGHGDGRNMSAELLPERAELIKGITGDVHGLSGELDASCDALMLIGYHDAASASGNPTSHTMVSSRIFSLKLNGVLVGEFELSAMAAALLGIPCVFVSGDEAVCSAASRMIPGVKTVPTKKGLGYSVLTRTPEAVLKDIEAASKLALEELRAVSPVALPSRFDVEITYLHHYDAKSASLYPGARLAAPTVVEYSSESLGDVLRMFHFII